MKFKKVVNTLLSLLLVGSVVSPGLALIKVDWTVEKLYKTSKAVVIGSVVDVTAESKVVNVNLTQALKGKSPGPKIRVQIVAPAELLKELKAEQPLVFFLADAAGADGNAGAVIHVGDTWLLANSVANSNSLVWRVVQAFDSVKQSFPGRTPALVKMVNDLNAGTGTFMDKFERKPFEGGMHARGKLGVAKPLWMLAKDLNGDKKPDLLIGSAAGVQLFLAKGDGYEEATEAWGLKGSTGGFHAIADINGNGKADLLLDRTLWLNQGQKFAAVNANFDFPTKAAPLTAALLDANGDQKPDAIFLCADGALRIFENPGAPEKAWTGKPAVQLWADGEAATFGALGDFGDTGKVHALVLKKSGVMRYALDADGGAVADLMRLTGVDFKKLEKYHGEFKNGVAVSLSMNGEARPDVFVYSDAGPMLLLNRGLGTFFLDESASAVLTSNGTKPLPLVPSAKTVWARADLRGKGVDDVLLLGEDGSLYSIENNAR